MTERGEISVEQRGVIRTNIEPGEVAFGTNDIYYNPAISVAEPANTNGNSPQEKTFIDEVDPNDPRYTYWQMIINKKRQNGSNNGNGIIY